MSLWTAWLLLMLRDGEGYGRALFDGLGEHGIRIDRALGYRTLRSLEDDGAIQSRWTQSCAGPRRRSYRLTGKGRRRLVQLIATIAATDRLHERFLLEHHCMQAGCEPALQSDDEALPIVSRGLLTAWLLLLVEREVSYGYGLRRALDERRVTCEPGALYRLLRRLEAEGCLQSRWMTSPSGPARRQYAVSGVGRRKRSELAAVLTATRASHLTLLHAYQRQTRSRRRPPDPAK